MAPSGGLRTTAGAAAYLIHHVVLPPKLPQKDDYDASHEHCLIDVVICALQDLQDRVDGQDLVGLLTSAITAITNLNDSRDEHGDVSEIQLLAVFRKLADATTNQTLPLEIKAQNAGLIVSRSGDSVVFESMELSPTNAAAMGSKGRLIRSFPGSVSKIPISIMKDSDFRKSHAYIIAKMNIQTAPEFQPSVRKNGQQVGEDRDTTDPSLVSNWFMHHLAALGGLTKSICILKNTREEVLWNDCRSPWRRSPLWLLIRVTLQLIFTRGGSIARPLNGLYKAVVAQVLSRILQSAKEHWAIVGSEALYVTYTKLARRIRKLEHLRQLELLKPVWAAELKASMMDIHDIINNHWSSLAKSPIMNSNTSLLRSLQPPKDLDIALPELEAFVSESSTRRQSNANASFQPNGDYPVYPQSVFPVVLYASGQPTYLRLAALEAWIEQHLDSWFSVHSHEDETCGKIYALMQLYHTAASAQYKGEPASLSLMYLSLFELWVAADKSACGKFPLLCEYNPEIALEELQCLVLPRKCQLQRLLKVERYIRARRDTADNTNPSIYEKFGHPSTFAVKFFDQSPALQATLADINHEATEKKKQKLEELASLQRQYQDLMDHYNRNECQTTTVVTNRYHGYTKDVHSSSCNRCASRTRASNLKIDIYEWPLSSDLSTAKATVFELQIPKALSDWRDASVFLISNVIGHAIITPNYPHYHYTLSEHHDLSHLLSAGYLEQRIVPLSSIKSHTSTHRKKPKVHQLSDSDVCPRNALQYSYYDRILRSYTGSSQSMEQIAKNCLYRMPDMRYKGLEQFLYRPPLRPDGKSPNEVIASLSNCPSHFSIDEYKAFGSLPFGRNIIYSSILAQLATPSIDFAKAETQTLLLQVVGQCGIFDDTPTRVSHSSLLYGSLCHPILQQLETSLERVSKNWESWRALAAYISICRRVLSLTSSANVCDRSLKFLARARQVSAEWLRRLKTRASDSAEEKQRSELYSRATEVALTCSQTLDVETKFIDIVLQQPSAISILLQCSIMIQENCELAQSESQPVYTSMLQAWKSMLYRIFTALRQHILQGKSGLHDAVRENWVGFQPDSGAHWNVLSEQHEHWLSIKSGSFTVCFNLLTAELLVNGLPLARLPPEFLKHPKYATLFGKSTLEVVPTNLPGMKFSANSTYRGYELHFGMRGGDMLVVAINDESKLELVPSYTFRDRLPHAFEADYVHWYDHTRGEVVFRPNEDPWCSGNSEWRLVQGGSSWRLANGKDVLVNINSDTSRALLKIFNPLENLHHIHTVFDTATSSLQISLPRLQLDFHIEHQDDRIQSRQYRGMIVDSVQTMGTLVGLTSKLVLSPSNITHDRMVLVPVPRTFDSGSVQRTQAFNQHHVSVNINKNKAHTVFAYSLDTTLGRVLESGDIQRRLFLAFLHAITSHCLPDPLTGYTGTESALQILQSASVRSFEYLTTDNIEMLYEIAALSPLRYFYPRDRMEMQQFDWDPNLPSLSQHPRLRTCAKGIAQQAITMGLFYPDHEPDISDWSDSNPHLEARNSIRSSTFRVYGFGAEEYSSVDDFHYKSRDVYTKSDRGEKTYIAASLIVRNQTALHTSILDLKGTLLQTHFKAASVRGRSDSFDPADLCFDAGWLSGFADKVKDCWCDLHHVLPGLSRTCNEYDIMAWLSTMAFTESADINVLQAFATFYRSHAMAAVKPPSAFKFDLGEGRVWVQSVIGDIVWKATKTFDDSAEAKIPKSGSETNSQHINRIEALFRSRRDGVVQAFIADLKRQWPCREPISPYSAEISRYLVVCQAMPQVTAKFSSWYRNGQFLDYLQQTSTAMAQHNIIAIVPPQHTIGVRLKVNSTEGLKMMFHVNNVFTAVPPCLTPPCEPKLPIQDRHTLSQDDRNKARLEQLCRSLDALATSKCEMDYVENLRASCTSLEALQRLDLETTDVQMSHGIQTLFQNYLSDCKEYFENLSLVLEHAVADNDLLSDEIGLLVRHSPRISPTFWLSQLHRDRFEILSEPWKTTVIEYGLAVTQLHRAQRLVALATKPADLLEELGYVGHTNWDPRKFPETLLLEAESGILIRKEQEFIASHMREPQDATNIVLQLLMGGGKSSTIIPMVAANLTDKKKLVRIIVAKPQSKQMLHMLVSKLGYLLNRPVYHMPFSRSIQLKKASATFVLRQIYEECIANRGVLLIQPEHILSFKLMAIEALLDGRESANSLLETQEFFDKVSRDIVDESDENFSVKFELIYTMGSQQSIEFAPERWIIIQAVLGQIPRFAKQVKNELPESIEVQRGDAGRFPRVRILRIDATSRLLSLLAKHVVEYGIVGLPTSSQSPNVQTALLRYITQAELTAVEISAVEDSRFWTDSTKSPLLLVRGLIAGGILQFALSTKRWRVNFGLDPTRVPETKLAVPFRSKDCPSPRSEFSHPDVVILLSLLSYYYGGLTDEQLFDSFAHVLKSDLRGIHYDEWVDTASPDLPTAFRHLSGVSIKDRHQCMTEVFPGLRYSKKAIDYYLSALVFPKAMKEFPQKLSASGWDIGAVKTNPVTGFSGTNDTLHLLPLSVKHIDLPSQTHTNALVLQYLLQDETSVELLHPRTYSSGSDAEHLLALIVQMQPEVRVFLDCGASILEQNNRQVAEAWLNMHGGRVQAVVFFDDEELSVLDRAGRVEPLQTSSFAKQLDVCLVYLDEAHTRGTDLKLPRNYRAAVTLGQGLVKDKLTQGCMRMRKLGVGQSVAFIVPEEISTKIRERTGKTHDSTIDVSDVICWSISETWQDLKRSMPLWAVQGEKFERNKSLLHGADTTLEDVENFLEDEAQSIQARYKPYTREDGSIGMLKNWDINNQNIRAIVTRCREFEATGFGAATLSEEQERELAPEIEEERQIERPVRLEPHIHIVHSHVEHLATTGQLVAGSVAFKSAFQALATTSAARLFPLGQFPTSLLVTEDFERTVKPPNGQAGQMFVSDSFQRPIQFVLSVFNFSSGDIKALVIISPYEANQLVSKIRKFARVTLHIFAPRANASFESLDKLELYNVGRAFSSDRVPRSLTVQLNLFTGSLYLRSFEEYTELCDFLGLLRAKPEPWQQVHADGFIDPPTGDWGMTRSPVPFLRMLLMNIRREGEGIEKTHLGKILSGVRLEEVDFKEDIDEHVEMEKDLIGNGDAEMGGM